MKRFVVLMIGASWAASCGGPASLTTVQAKVFTPSCAFGTCHNPPQGAGDLVLNTGTHSKIVNVPSPQVPTMKRVVPGKPEESFLYLKLTKTTDDLRQYGPDAGESMPPGEPLEAERLELVREWIANGAKND